MDRSLGHGLTKRLGLGCGRMRSSTSPGGGFALISAQRSSGLTLFTSFILGFFRQPRRSPSTGTTSPESRHQTVAANAHLQNIGLFDGRFVPDNARLAFSRGRSRRWDLLLKTLEERRRRSTSPSGRWTCCARQPGAAGARPGAQSATGQQPAGSSRPGDGDGFGCCCSTSRLPASPRRKGRPDEADPPILTATSRSSSSARQRIGHGHLAKDRRPDTGRRSRVTRRVRSTRASSRRIREVGQLEPPEGVYRRPLRLCQAAGFDHDLDAGSRC
jgi:hypothetical protein